MQILKVDENKIEEIIKTTCEVLRHGGLVIYPTETCYGVGVDATNQSAVDKLIEYKKRPEGKAVSIAVYDMDMAKKYVELNETAKNIYKEFLPGPVTVVSKCKTILAKGIAAEDNTIGVRIPKYELALKIIKEFNNPITATSANSAGKKTPYRISDIFENISFHQKNLIDLIIDAGELEHNPPSTVIDTTKEHMKLLRRGAVGVGKLVMEEIIESPEEMQKVAYTYISKYKNIIEDRIILIMFNAELGAGKTQFVKGLASALGINSNVNSPTFVLVKEYQYNIPGKEIKKGNLIHIDAWRIETIEELANLEIHEYFKKGNIIALEWAGMAQDYLKTIANKNIIKIYIEIEYIDLGKRLLKIFEEE